MVLLAWAQPAVADGTRDASWQLDFLGIDAAQQLSQGAGITVAVVDTGVDGDHPDLRGNVLPGINLYDPGSAKGGQDDDSGHGTAVASLIAGHGHGPGGRDGVLGVAPKAKILPVIVKRTTSITPPSAIGQGIQYAVDHGAQVICVALSGSSSDVQTTAVRAASGKNVLVFASAGNDGLPVLAYPAAIRGVIAVTGVVRDGTPWKDSSTGEQASLAAPAVDVPAAAPGGGYQLSTGTSPAAAIAAGVGALVRSRFPTEDRSTVLRRLLLTATDKGERGHDWDYGFGIVNPAAALAPAAPPKPTRAAPTVPAIPAPSAAPPEKPGAGFGELAVIVAVAIGLFVLIEWICGRRRRRKAAAPEVVAPPVPQLVPDDDRWRRPGGPPPTG